MEGTESASSGGNSAPASSGPSTFAEAFASDASPASAPDAQSNAPADAAAPPTDAAASPQQQDDRSPFIPRTRFDEVNTERNALKTWKEQYAWAEQVDRNALTQAVQLGQRYQQDPAGYIRDLMAEAAGNPALAQMVRSEAARLLAQGQVPAQPEQPQVVPVQLEDGSVVNMPRDPQKWLAWHQQQWAQQMEQKMAPALSAAQKLQHAEDKDKATQWSAGFLGEVSQYQGFEEHKAEIGQEVRRVIAQLQPNDPRGNSVEFLEAVTLRAYNRVVLPKLNARTESKLLDSLQQKAAASTSPNPGSAAPSTQGRVNTFHDKRLVWK